MTESKFNGLKLLFLRYNAPKCESWLAITQHLTQVEFYEEKTNSVSTKFRESSAQKKPADALLNLFLLQLGYLRLSNLNGLYCGADEAPLLTDPIYLQPWGSFMHHAFGQQHPLQANYYWVVGGSIDRAYESVRSNDNWKKKWAGATFESLPEKAQQFVLKYGNKFGWPPHATDWKKACIGGWLFAPAVNTRSAPDFFQDYIRVSMKTNDISEYLNDNRLQRQIVQLESSTGEFPNDKEQYSSQPAFARYRYNQAVSGEGKEASLRKALVTFLVGQTEAPHLIAVASYQPTSFFDRFDTNKNAMLALKASGYAVHQQQVKVQKHWENSKYKALSSWFFENMLNQSARLRANSGKTGKAKGWVNFFKTQVKNIKTLGQNQTYDEKRWSKNASDRQISVKRFIAHFYSSNKQPNALSSWRQSQDKSSAIELHANGVFKLLQFDGFLIFGTRQNNPFILPVWGFFNIDSYNTEIEDAEKSWEHSIYARANHIRRPNSMHRYVLDRYSAVPSINYPTFNTLVQPAADLMKTGSAPVFSNNSSTFFNLNLLALPFGRHGSHVPNISDAFGTASQHPYWAVVESRLNKNIAPISLNRVKFKNNLPAIWRRLRTEFATLLNMKFHYEKQLTKLLPNFYKNRGISIFKTAEFSLGMTLVKVRFALTLECSWEMIDASWVHLNGRVVRHRDMQILKYDFIQLPVSAKYFAYFRWLYAWMLKKKGKLMPRVIMIAEARGSSKKKAVRYPNWILTNRHADEDIPSYFEVDFMSMSAIMLAHPQHFDEFDCYNMTHLNVYTPKMLNWKYIN